MNALKMSQSYMHVLQLNFYIHTQKGHETPLQLWTLRWKFKSLQVGKEHVMKS